MSVTAVKTKKVPKSKKSTQVINVADVQILPSSDAQKIVESRSKKSG